jgi:hypothetical protein
VKYVVLIYNNPKNWRQSGSLSKEEQDAQFDAFYAELKASGKLMNGTPLAAPETTKTITERNGVISITDGPFAEAKEQLAGFLILDCETIEEAYEIAKNFPDIKNAGVEIRPVAV